MADTRARGNIGDRAIDSRGKEALDKIFSKQKHGNLLLDQQVISELKRTLSDSKLVEVVYDYYKKRLEQIKQKANKFKRALLHKYGMANLSIDQLVDKAKKYTKKYDLSDGEFNMFMGLLQSDTTHPYNSRFNIPSTPMSRTLGYSVDAIMGDKLSLSERDYPVLKQILEVERETLMLHKQAIIQSITYMDCGPEALNGKYDKDKYNVFKHVHPIIAAMFLPKVPYLDEHMIHASIGNIVKCKKDGLPIVTLPEYELYWDLISDPNHTVCVTDDNKTMEDLRNRFMLQTKLWEAVVNLRQGKYYFNNATDIMLALENCMSSIFDAPDLVYAHDEGTILRRILNTFSMRPTIVSISSLSDAPMAMTTYNIGPASYTQITTVPMVNLRLPRQLGGIYSNTKNTISTINLTDALNQPQWFIEGKTLIPKTQSIVHSRDVIFFYIDRRYKAFNYSTINQPFMFAGFLPSISGLDTINDTAVNYMESITIGKDSFELRSVIFTEVTDLQQKGGIVITGCSAGIVRLEPMTGVKNHLLYDPQGAGFQHLTTAGTYESYGPISDLDTQADKNFVSLSQKRGTIFMYAKRQFGDTYAKNM
jgi:hypothetical protein